MFFHIKHSRVTEMSETGKILVIDCQIAGISGDMFLGALIDLGADVNKVVSAIKSLEIRSYGYKNIKIDIEQVMRKEFKATKIDVTAKGTSRKDASELVEIVEKCAKK